MSDEADDQNGNLQGAVDKISALEKQTRNVSHCKHNHIGVSLTASRPTCHRPLRSSR